MELVIKMIEVLKHAKGYLEYLKKNPDTASPFYEEDLDNAIHKVAQVEKCFLLELDVLVPSMCYFLAMKYQKRIVPQIESVDFCLSGKWYTYIYIVDEKFRVDAKNYFLKLCKMDLDENQDKFYKKLFSNGYGTGITIYPKGSKPKYLCLPEYFSYFSHIPDKAMLYNDRHSLPLYCKQIIEGNLKELGYGDTSFSNYLDTRAVRDELPGSYLKKIPKMSE